MFRTNLGFLQLHKLLYPNPERTFVAELKILPRHTKETLIIMTGQLANKLLS
jgi:hypothetical protein